MATSPPTAKIALIRLLGGHPGAQRQEIPYGSVSGTSLYTSLYVAVECCLLYPHVCQICKLLYPICAVVLCVNFVM